MKKLIVTLILIIFTSVKSAFAENGLRPYAPLVIKKGTFLKGINQRQLSTANADEGDLVTFIAPVDIWCGEAKIVPKNSIYHGVIEELLEPVQGTNAAMKIRINKLELPDKTEVPIDAYVTYNGSTTIGGELTPPMVYTRSPHYIYYPNVYKGVLQYVPGKRRFFGNHLVIKSGAEMVIMLESDFQAINADY